MGYWGWRPLILAMFISVWVIGCTVAHETAPPITPTEYPQITLTVHLARPSTPTQTAVASSLAPTRRPTPAPQASPSPVIYVVASGDTLLGIAQTFGVELGALQAANSDVDPLALQIGQSLVIPNPANTRDGFPIRPTPTPRALGLPAPTCYEMRTGSLFCLGEVENVLDQPVERVRVAVQLVRADGTALSSRAADLDQRIIPPGQSAPYRVLFAHGEGVNAPDDVEATALLLRADAALEVDARLVALDVLDEGGAMSGGQYVVSATLANPTSHTAEAIRLVVTVRDEQGRVTGYRVMETGWSLAAGESRPVVISAIPYAPAVTHTLYAEAVRGG